MDVVDVIKNFIWDTPAPWRVTLWTLPADGTDPSEYTAGFFSILATSAEIPNEDPKTLIFYKEGEGMCVIIPQAIGELERLEEGIRFFYKNIKTVPEDFCNDTLITITRVDLDGGGL